MVIHCKCGHGVEGVGINLRWDNGEDKVGYSVHYREHFMWELLRGAFTS